MQWGNIAGGWTSRGSIPYSLNFASGCTPFVLCTMSNTTNNSYSGTPKVYNKTNTSFTISPNSSNEILNSSLSWIAIGY